MAKQLHTKAKIPENKVLNKKKPIYFDVCNGEINIDATYLSYRDNSFLMYIYYIPCILEVSYIGIGK